jgi:hypothetical protein
MKKKIYTSICILTGVLFIALINLSAGKSIPSKSGQEPESPFPPEVDQVFNNSCTACHGIDGKALAKSHLDLSAWNDYSASKQKSKAMDICKEMSSGSMPPKAFKKAHPELVPTDEQVNIVCHWSESLRK